MKLMAFGGETARRRAANELRESDKEQLEEQADEELTSDEYLELDAYRTWGRL